MLQSSLEEHRIVDVEPRAEEPLAGEPEMKEDTAPFVLSLAAKGKRKRLRCRWRSIGSEPKRSMIGSWA